MVVEFRTKGCYWRTGYFLFFVNLEHQAFTNDRINGNLDTTIFRFHIPNKSGLYKIMCSATFFGELPSNWNNMNTRGRENILFLLLTATSVAYSANAEIKIYDNMGLTGIIFIVLLFLLSTSLEKEIFAKTWKK